MLDAERLNPSTQHQALAIKTKRNVAAIAGGTDLMVRLHDIIDRPHPKLLVLEGIKSLHKISMKNGCVSIGPLVTFAEIEQSNELRSSAPQLVQAASLAGSVQIRNRATIGGNIANASPAGDLIPPLYVLGAKLELSSVKGKRRVAIEEFFVGPGKTLLKSSELITSIVIPNRSNNKSISGFFLRLGTRQALAISKVSVAASIHFSNDLEINSARIALGAVGPTVIRAFGTENYLIGKRLIDEVIYSAAEIAKGEAKPIDDIRSNAEYRREMVGVLLRRGLRQIITEKR